MTLAEVATSRRCLAAADKLHASGCKVWNACERAMQAHVAEQSWKAARGGAERACVPHSCTLSVLLFPAYELANVGTVAHQLSLERLYSQIQR